MKVRILGSGTSSGVPRIGNDWGDCDPHEPKNRRTRPSMLISTDTTRILIDTSPDMREQLLAADVATVDAVVWTHDHADHTHGIDDLRQVFHARGAPVPGYARPDTLQRLTSRFGYAFSGGHGYRPTIEGCLLADRLTIGDIAISVVDQPHGNITSTGLLLEHGGKRIAYATDFSELTPAMRALYDGADIWVVDALRRRPHPTHPHLAQVVKWVAELRPGKTALMHLDNSMDYATLAKELPDGVQPGYDGLELTA
ncbi:MBL fold metallo-hydrolase [Stakelama marina]|uniref:MBL fold metallo-hydrolase n=1 Tax=Stakelama marina TaxID=2826939 RepID=A0A8T4IH21_9SPHN|nr:MBL fold metallo-hydrolase [Stakelama marina]MBR0551589.1 MBL fold metallo-hydrolase [Stakelama marina]